MKFQVEWIGGAENAVPEERAAVASLRIFVDGKNAAAHHEEAGKQHDCLTVSVYGLADGIAREWWRIFGGRGKPVTLRRYRDGYALPDARMRFDGQQVWIWAEALAMRNPPVRFESCPLVSRTRADVERDLADFIGLALERLKEQGLKSTSLEQCWQRVLASREDATEAAFCEAAGALHLDPYAISDADADFITRAAREFEGESLLEFLSAVRNVDRSRVEATLEDISAIQGDETRLSNLREIAAETKGLVRQQSGQWPWSLGYQSAARLREVLCHGTSPSPDSLSSDIPKMATWFGASPGMYKAEKDLVGLLALRRDVEDDIHIVIRKSEPGDTLRQRFAFARAVGDAICFPDGGSAPVNELDSAYRQAAGRAFAAEFLAPIAAVEKMSKDGRDVYEIAERLHVHSEVIARQFENAGRIRSVQSR